MKKIINIFYLLFLIKDKNNFIIRNDRPKRSLFYKINRLLSDTKNKKKFTIFFDSTYNIDYKLK